MTTQRHQIQRQVFELTVSHRELANVLHDELPQWQTRGLEALVDACCSELSSPDRVHRLGRVEVDLGRLSLGDLEQAITDKLGPALREVLAKKIQAVEMESARLGEDPEVQARIELVSLFARTGTLPFWADTGNPKLVDETVEWLLARAPGDLVALVRWFAADRRALERLVRHVEAMRLLGLLKVLVDVRGSRVADARAAEAWEALGVLGGAKVPATFENLGAKVPATFENLDARSSPGFSGAGGTPNSPAQARAQTAGPPRPRQKNSGEDLNTFTGEQEAPGGEVLEKVPPLLGLGGEVLEKVPATFAGLGGEVLEKVPATFEKVPATFVWLSVLGVAARHPTLARDAVAFWREIFREVATATRIAYPNVVQAFYTQQTTYDSALKRVLDLLHAAVSTFPQAIDTFQHPVDTFQHPVDTFRQPVDTLQHPVDTFQHPVDTFQHPVDVLANHVDSKQDHVRAMPKHISRDTGQRESSVRQRSRAKHLPDRHAQKKPFPSADPDEVYLDASGLVLLWPFIGNFFNRLGLVQEGKSFVDENARHRGVLLLHWLGTEEWNPPEFRLPLCKTLCGVPLDVPIDDCGEMTETEQTEGSNLLAAVLAHGKNFGEVSVDEFRRAFLCRRGVLTTQNNTWLLRVERAPYDLVLRALPWPLLWISLPWMQAPLFVEWVK